jgi:hypothetical protein
MLKGLVQDTLLMLLQRIRELRQHSNARSASAGQPIPEHLPRAALVWLRPDLPQVFLEIVGDGERFIQAQRFLQPFQFIAALVKVLRVLEQQPTRTLEDFAFFFAAGLVIEFAPKGAELLVEQLDHVEVIEDMHRPGQVVAHGTDVGG